MPTDQFKMFASGLGGDFETYVGATSGTIYRLDLGKVHYQRMSREDLLADALEKETQLIPIPQNLRCKICGTVFSVTNVPIDGEETVDAYEI
jgi:hypothetical protein